MKRRHFETLRPICPACRVERGDEPPLGLSIEAVAGADEVLEGVLQCPEPACLREYPILDGIPLLVPDVASYLGSQISHLRDRDDLSPVIEALLAVNEKFGTTTLIITHNAILADMADRTMARASETWPKRRSHPMRASCVCTAPATID